VISIDAMGGDHGPPVAVAGAAEAVRRLSGKQVRFLLHGDEARIEAELRRFEALRPLVEIRHTAQIISGEEKPAQALRRGKGSSLWNAVEAIRQGEAAAAVSGGNTGALMAISKLILRMISSGLERPAIVASWPTARGVTALLDVGANIDCAASQLVEFAIMGDAFYRAVHAADPAYRPTVGVLNVGSEEMKGHEEVREANRLLREGGFDFDYRGFVEGNDIAGGAVDVIVTDGFTGNIALKTGEGLARFFAATLKQSLTADPLSMAGAVLAKGGLDRLRARLTPPGGGPLLGLNGTVVKSHGGTDASGFADAIKIAYNLAASRYIEEIGRNIERLSVALAPDVKTNVASEAKSAE
jgi:phosphate acyltransferase